MKENNLSIADLKALYDFACFHCELKTHTGTKEDIKFAERNRDTLYMELERKLNFNSALIRTKHTN